MKSLKIVIKDSLINEFYCVPMTYKNEFGEPTTGDFDFPYWSADVENAWIFISERLANYEIEMNDLTEDGTRNPIVIILEF